MWHVLKKKRIFPSRSHMICCEGDEEKQAGTRWGQRAPRRPVWHPAAVVPDETHEEQTTSKGELLDQL